ncbi:ABC transporter ATP-binding protein [Actinomyces dentalis]|uniref:ABC transporter ATP-binding protein n=1 Tax=Actinomyces dentalis TaxID=272548 RepID=UPI0009FCB4FE|nr:ABC transporter ATP-binding protein [Actinomyces dentalis]
MSGVPGAAAEWSQTTRGADVVVEARDVVRVYGSGEARVVALGGVSLSVERGQFVAVMGPSGSGKSTLLHCLAGLDTPTSGSVLIAGEDLAGMNDAQLTRVRRDRLGFVFQAFNLLPTLSAEENILLPLRLARRRPDEQWYRAVIDALGIADRLDHRPSQLSGGQQQRVAVARALAGRPEVVFADEPTGALDTASAASLLQALGAMCRNLGQTVVMVTHDENAAAATNRIIRLTDGHITTDNPTTHHHGAAPHHHAAPAGPAARHGAPAGPDAPAAAPGPDPAEPPAGDFRATVPVPTRRPTRTPGVTRHPAAPGRPAASYFPAPRAGAATTGPAGPLQTRRMH